MNDKDPILTVDVQLDRGAFRLEANLEFRNTVTGLFGPSGSGKSTLLSVIAGLVNPQFGSVRLSGIPLFDTENGINTPPDQRRIGYVFQDGMLFPHLSVKGNLLYGYNLIDPALRRFHPDQIIELLEIGPLLSRRPRTLSGGEKQRVALGRALLPSPHLLLLDEPLAALDVGLKQQILPFLKRIKDEINIPMIYVSHAIGEILHLTDHLAVMEKGRILGIGPFLEVMKDEEILNLSQSLGLENVIPLEVVCHDPDAGYTVGRINQNELHLPFSTYLPGETVFVTIRPEDIALATQPLSGISIQNQIPGVITGISQVGRRVLVQADIGIEILSEVTLKTLKNLGLKEGNTIYCMVKTHSISYLGSRVE